MSSQSGSTVVEWVTVVAELLVAWVIFYEFEGTRLDHFLIDVESKSSRKEIFDAYCGLSGSALDRGAQLRALLEQPASHKLRDTCDENVRLFSRVGARLPTLPIFRKHTLDWHVVVFVWVMVGPYVMERRRLAGSTFAITFLRYAYRSTVKLLNSQKDRDCWAIVDPNRERKGDVYVTRGELEKILEELKPEVGWWTRLWRW